MSSTPSRWDPSHAVTLADIRGWPAVSYLRYSSAPQGREGRDSIARQQQALAHAVSTTGLVLDRALEDRAKSASKGHHRQHGELGAFLETIEEGAVPPGTVLIAENIDRVTRESVLDAYPMIAKMVRKGVLLLVCDDNELTLYDEHAINGRAGDDLHSEIRRAYKQARRIAQQARGAHQRRRERAAKGEKVTPNGRPHGWIDRVPVMKDGRLTYDHILNQQAATIHQAALACIAGASLGEICDGLNARGVPYYGGGPWRSARLGAILRDDTLIGYYTPMQWNNGERKYVAQATLNYPAVLSATEWAELEDALDGRKKVERGAHGKTIPNLFAGHAKCLSCGANLRVDTGGGIRHGKRKRHLLCGRYMEAKTCTDGRRYDLDVFERPILMKLLELLRIAPRRRRNATEVVERLAKLRIGIDQKTATIDTLAALPTFAAAPVLIQQVEKLGGEVTEMQRELHDLTIAASSIASEDTRLAENWRLIRETISPAISGEVEARDRLRGLLARLDYQIVGAGSAMEVMVGERSEIVDPLAPDAVDQEAEQLIAELG